MEDKKEATAKVTPPSATYGNYTFSTDTKPVLTANEVRKSEPNTSAKPYENYTFTTTRLTSNEKTGDKTSSTSTIPSQFKPAEIPRTNITTINSEKTTPSYSTTVREDYTLGGTLGTAGSTNVRNSTDLSSNYLIRKADTSTTSKLTPTDTKYDYYSSNNYRVTDTSANTLNRDSQESTNQPLATDGIIKRSFDRSTNYIRISARNGDNQEPAKALFQSW